MAAPPWAKRRGAEASYVPRTVEADQAEQLSRDAYTWQCAICLEQQPVMHVSPDVLAYCTQRQAYNEYVAHCAAVKAPVREGVVALPPPPPLLRSDALLLHERCRDCGAPGHAVTSQTFTTGSQAAAARLPLLATLLAQNVRFPSSPPLPGPRDFDAAVEYMTAHGITAEFLATALTEEGVEWSQGGGASLDAAEPRGYLCPTWGPRPPSVGLVYHPAMEAHGAPIPQSFEDVLTDEELGALRAGEESLQSMSGALPRPRPVLPCEPERPDRVWVAAAYLAATGLLQACVRVPCRQASEKELRRVLTAEHAAYIAEKHAQCASSGGGERGGGGPHAHGVILTGDTFWNAHTQRAAQLAAGGVISAMEAVLTGHVQRALALVRPPGHHADADCSRGFCIVNSVGAAAKAAVDGPHGLQRVLIVDWDIHHGDGTEALFYNDPRVLFLSVHRYDGGAYYPGSGSGERVGAGAGEGYTLNIPLDGDWYGDADYAYIWESVVLPVSRCFDPQLVLVSAGWDAARGDYLGDFDVTPAGYAHLTHGLLGLAGGKLVLAMEGGYNLNAIAASTAAVTRVLLGEAPPGLDEGDSYVNPVKEARQEQEGRLHVVSQRREASATRYHSASRLPSSRTVAAVRSVAAVHAQYWPVLHPLLGAADAAPG